MPEDVMILSLDGGGVFGLYQAVILKQIEREIFGEDGDIAKHFQLITGTSTGGLIALSLASGHSVDEIINFYETYSSRIFPHNVLQPLRILSAFLFRSLYNNKNLKQVLSQYFGNQKIGDLSIPVCIPAINTVTCTPIVFKTANSEKLTRDFDNLLVDVAMATSAAPIYFQTYRFGPYQSLVDGGLWQNNPSLIGLIEANNFFLANGCGCSTYKKVSILSIGNPLSNHSSGFFKPRICRSSLLAWRNKLVTLPMKVTSTGIDLQMRLIERNKAMNLDKYLRIASDQTSDYLKNLKMDSSKKKQLELIKGQAFHDFNLKKNDIINFFKK